MVHVSSRLMRAVTLAALAMIAMFNGTLAQTSDTETITVTVNEADEPYVCPSQSPTVLIEHGSGESFNVPAGATDADASVSFSIRMSGVGCEPWSLSVEIDDFALDEDSSVTFAGSTFSLVKDATFVVNPVQIPAPPWATWLDELPDDLPRGAATMPDGAVTFSSTTGTAPYTGSAAVMSSSTEPYGSPGYWTAFYQGVLTGVPAGQDPGTYTATIKLTLQGDD